MMGPVRWRWSGMVMETTDGAAFIGRNPGDAPNIFIATGDSGMGMTHGTIAGLILSDLILGRYNRWAEFYDPARKPVLGMALQNFLSENVNVGAEYVRDWLGGDDSPAAEDLEPDQGTVVRRGLTKVAVYRDEAGHLHECSAVCSHLGCIVHWNDLEKVWDCPCHGSRFDAYGEVINGPAISPLKSSEKPQTVSASS
jgi:nitrite reductase/ring-hydroxylating ferredoxin subunit